MIILYPACILASTVAASVFVWYKKPGVLIRSFMRFALYQAGVKMRYVMAGKYRYCYGEKGRYNKDKLTLLFVHGFSASKDMWVPIVKKLPKDIHVILVDLPGHGDSTVPADDDDISVLQITQCLHDFITKLGINERPFHMVGTSLGGAIAGLYAANFPKNLAKLTVICPAMKTPVKTEFLQEVEAGHCRLIPDTVDGMQRMMDSCMYNKVSLHKQIMKGILQTRLPKNDFYQRLFEELSSSEKHQDEMLESLTKIKVPTQVVWGKQDELIHVSGVEVLREKIPNLERVDILDKCGHSVNMDRSGMVTKVLLQFRGEYQKKESKRD